MQTHEYFLKKTHLGPKRRVWRRLGPFPSLPLSFSLPVVHLVVYNLYKYNKDHLVCKKTNI